MPKTPAGSRRYEHQVTRSSRHSDKLFVGRVQAKLEWKLRGQIAGEPHCTGTPDDFRSHFQFVPLDDFGEVGDCGEFL